jgi:hypothetical protein
MQRFPKASRKVRTTHSASNGFLKSFVFHPSVQTSDPAKGTLVPVRFQVVSDVVRDGLGLELLNENNKVLAEVFRHDASHRLTVTCFEPDLELTQLESLISRARTELDPFEDGTPFNLAAGGGRVSSRDMGSEGT